jgi:hypothetical protein
VAFTIARNVIISHAAICPQETIVDPEVMREIAPKPRLGVEVMQQEELREIADMVRTFPQREQDIISLKFDAELSNPQIAEIMGLSEPNVRVIIFRTLRKLRELVRRTRAVAFSPRPSALAQRSALYAWPMTPAWRPRFLPQAGFQQDFFGVLLGRGRAVRMAPGWR